MWDSDKKEKFAFHYSIRGILAFDASDFQPDAHGVGHVLGFCLRPKFVSNRKYDKNLGLALEKI